MNLHDLMEADASIFFNLEEHGEEIVYNLDEIVAVIESGVSRTAGNTYSLIEGMSATGFVWLRVSDVESPKPGDSIIFPDGSKWEVARILLTNGGIHQLEVIGDENPWGTSNARQNRIT